MLEWLREPRIKREGDTVEVRGPRQRAGFPLAMLVVGPVFIGLAIHEGDPVRVAFTVAWVIGMTFSAVSSSRPTATGDASGLVVGALRPRRIAWTDIEKFELFRSSPEDGRGARLAVVRVSAPRSWIKATPWRGSRSDDDARLVASVLANWGTRFGHPPIPIREPSGEPPRWAGRGL